MLILAAAMASLQASAQRRGRGYSQVSTYLKTRNALDDSISNIAENYAQKLDSVKNKAERIADEKTNKGTTLENPYFYPLFVGNTLMPKPIKLTLGTIDVTEHSSVLVPRELQSIAWTLADAYAAHPELISSALPALEGTTNEQRTEANSQFVLPSDKNDETRKNATQAATAPVNINKQQHEDSNVLDLSDFHIHVRRPNFWTLKGSYSTQFMQYYVSDNWYKGGDNHVSMLAAFNFEANYDNKRKLTFNNKLETKLGFQTSPSDSYHKFKTNTDLLRLTNKLGVKAWHHWDYTLMLQSWTQFYKAYKSNSPDVASDFMSPFEAVLSAGMDYKLQKKRVNFAATLSPVAANLKYCDRERLVKNHGIEEGKHHKIDLGSTITVNMTLKFCEQVNWVTRLYAFYDYKDHLKAEWENTINLKINKYLSTKLFLYPRFDNNVQKKNEDDSYFQFNEYLSVGLDLNF